MRRNRGNVEEDREAERKRKGKRREAREGLWEKRGKKRGEEERRKTEDRCQIM